MLWVPQKGIVKQISNLGIVGTDTPGTAIVSNATTLLDGAIAEVISAANNIQDSWGILINIFDTAALITACEACADILIGGATDDVLISALICGHAGESPTGSRTFGVSYFFPLHIPAGVRIAARLASVRVSITARIIIILYGGSPPPWRVGRKVTTIGTGINNARGQAVVPAASGGAASVTEIIASSAENYFAFLPGFQPATDTTLLLRSYNIGIGVGAAPEDRIGTWLYIVTVSEVLIGHNPAFPAFCDVPAGSRLSLLASNSGTNETAYDGYIYAVS